MAPTRLGSVCVESELNDTIGNSETDCPVSMLECMGSIVPWTMVLTSGWQLCGGASTSIVLYRRETLYYGLKRELYNWLIILILFLS